MTRYRIEFDTEKSGAYARITENNQKRLFDIKLLKLELDVDKIPIFEMEHLETIAKITEEPKKKKKAKYDFIFKSPEEKDNDIDKEQA